MATGDFVEMAASGFTSRLYDATALFQNTHGIEPSGVLTPQTHATLSAVGGRIFKSWGMQFLDHPVADVAVAAPGRMGLEATSTRHGVALENKYHTMSVAFLFFAEGEATLQSVFDNLTRLAPGDDVAMQVLKPQFLAVAGIEGGRRTYSRYILVQRGIAGFSLTWNPSVYLDADRIAVVMANELYPRRMAGGDIFAQLPSDASPIGSGADDDAAQRQREAQQKAEQERENARLARLDQARLAREAEDARNAKEVADRRAAQDQIKAAQLASAKSTAEDALKDAADFVKSNHDDPQLLDHLQAIADLKTLEGGSDPGALDRGRSKLQARLKSDSVYAAWEEQQAAERRRAYERDLRDTLAVLSVQRRFLVDQVAADPTGSNAGKWLDLVRQADATIAILALAPAQSLVGRIDAAIQEANLGQRYALARDDTRKQSGGAASPKP